MIGLSQGGLIARAVAERCAFNGTVTRLVTAGGPHMGNHLFFSLPSDA